MDEPPRRRRRDVIIPGISESLKAIVNTTFNESARVASAASAVVYCAYQPGHIISRRFRWSERGQMPQQARQPEEQEPTAFALLFESSSPKAATSEPSLSRPSQRDRSGSFIRDRSGSFIRSGTYQPEQSQSTGLVEDIQLSILNVIDKSSAEWYCLRPLHILRSLPNPLSYTRKAMTSMPHKMQHITQAPNQGMLETVSQMVGLRCESHTVRTEDGYVLQLIRIPNPKSHRVVYFQHGLLDTCLGWVCSGPRGSQALRAYEKGYDVFLGNLRGVGEKQHMQGQGIASRHYWDFTCDTHGQYDVRAFMQAIQSIKDRERRLWQPTAMLHGTGTLDVTAVAHSLGGAVLMIYLLHCIQHRIPHGLKQLILLSPAGYHRFEPWWLRMGMPMAYYSMLQLITHFRVPSGSVYWLFAKCQTDLLRSPDVGSLYFSALSSFFGGFPEQSPFKLVDLQTYNMSWGGVSAKVLRHGIQCFLSGNFQAYDYGEEGNQVAYGQSQPPCYTEMYRDIDIPVHFACGGEDLLIPPQNVITQYMACNRQLATLRVFPTASHLDFTIGQNDDIVSWVMSHLTAAPTPPHTPPCSRREMADTEPGPGRDSGPNQE